MGSVSLIHNRDIYEVLLSNSSTTFLQQRIVLITGKGGVGKTTLSLCLARALARSGRKVLLTEPSTSDVDMPPLARLIGADPIADSPTSVTENLFYTPLLARVGHELFLRSVIPTPTMIRAALRSKAVSRFLTAAPSLHEMGLFYHLLMLLERRSESNQFSYDHIIVDMPATGHALALTQLPEILLRLIPKGPIAEALRRGKTIINDPKQGTSWVVSLPQKLPVTESMELIEGLNASDMHCSGVFLNMMPQFSFTERESVLLREWCQRFDWVGETVISRSEQASEARLRLAEELEMAVLEIPELNHLDDIESFFFERLSPC